MLSRQDRKAASAAYRERKATAGVYSVRCVPTGAVWIGVSPDLDKVENRLWFSLRSGGCPNPGLQAAWRQHGGDAFDFAVIERIATDAPDYFGLAQLEKVAARRRAELGAGLV